MHDQCYSISIHDLVLFMPDLLQGRTYSLTSHWTYRSRWFVSANISVSSRSGAWFVTDFSPCSHLLSTPHIKSSLHLPVLSANQVHLVSFHFIDLLILIAFPLDLTYAHLRYIPCSLPYLVLRFVAISHALHTSHPCGLHFWGM